MIAREGVKKVGIFAMPADLAAITRLHIVAIAAGGTFTFGVLFTGRSPWWVAAIAGFDWFCVNLLNRVVDLPEDRANAIRGTDLVSRHRRALVGLGFGALGASFLLVPQVEPAIWPLRLGFHALGLAYNWPILPGARRVKQLYFFKNTASSVGFMLTVFCYPLASALTAGLTLAPGVTASTVAVAGLFFFPFAPSYEVIYDLRDAPGDRLAGVRSYPAVHGERVAVRIADGLIVLSISMICGGYLLGFAPWRLFIMVAAPLVQLVLLHRALGRGPITTGFCVGLTWLGAALLVTYHLWIALDLPGAGR